ncbi:MAG: hypothetical protein IKE18_03440 [Oscillospiraceae bacterium]|nr:hypothetical protein [Oscillospiraceae bacterium]
MSREQFSLFLNDGVYRIESDIDSEHRLYVSFSPEGFYPGGGYRIFGKSCEVTVPGIHRPFFFIICKDGGIRCLADNSVTLGSCTFTDAGGEDTVSGDGYTAYGRLYFSGSLIASPDSVMLVRELGIEVIADIGDTFSKEHRKDIQYDGVRMYERDGKCPEEDDPESIVADECIGEILKYMISGKTILVHGGPGYRDADRVREVILYLLGCRAEGYAEYIENRYGSAQKYASSVFGIDSEDLKKIKKGYLREYKI